MTADRSVLVRLRANISDFQRNFRTAGAEADTLTRKLEAADRRGGRAIDSMSGRVGLLVDALLTVGPAALPIGAVAVPAVAALASSLGFAAVAAGGAALAFGGVGDALGTLKKAHLDPTEENLAAVEEALNRLSPAAADFVEKLDSMRGLVGDLREAGAEELFPGLVDALDMLETRGPDVERIIRSVNGALGDIARDGAESLASSRWDDFFEFLADEAPEILDSTADSLGSLTHGLAELWMAFTPLSEDGLDWMEDAAENFDRWATNLSKTEGFEAFSDYIRQNGPQVAETLDSVADAAIAIVEAAAPLGGSALSAIESFADIVAQIAESDFATPLLAAVGAMRAINRLAPGAAGGLAIMSGGAAAGAGGRRGKGGRGAAGAGPLVAGLIGADIIADQLDWEEATDRQVTKGEEFAKRWGASISEQAETARVKLTELLDVSTGKGPFGLLANDTGLTEEFLNKPLKKQLELRKQLREEYGVGLKQLEEHGILLEGTTRQFEHQREQVGGLTRLLKTPLSLAVDNKPARQKLDEAEDWILGWGRRNAEARADVDDSGRRRKSKAADDWILNWGRSNAEATVDADARAAFGTFYRVNADLMALDGKRATTYVDTVRTVTGPKGAAVTGSAAGSTVPNDGGPYTDRFPYLLAPGEEVISNRNGQADRNRPLLKAINAGRMAGGGTSGETPKERLDRVRREREDRRRRAEERRQRQLDQQQTKGMLASDLDDEGQQANLGVLDARRRLQSARKADRPKSELLDLKLLLKQARNERGDVRSERAEEQARKILERQEKASEIALLAAEDQLEAAEKNQATAKADLEVTKQLRDSLKESVAGQFKGSLTGGGLAGLMKTLQGDIAGGSAMTASLQALKDAGLDTTGAASGLFKELAASNDLKTINELLAAGPDAIEAAEQAYLQRDQGNAARGEFVAEAAYGQMIAQQTAAVEIAQQQVAQAEANTQRLEAQLAQANANLQNVAATVAAQGAEFAAALNNVSANAVRGSGWGNVGRKPR